MTHGDQAKAKAAKSSQASGNQKSSSKTAGKAVQTGKGSQAAGKEGGEGSKPAKIAVKKPQAGSEKGGSPAAAKAGASSAKEAGNGGKGKGRPVPPPAADATTGFSNPTVANAFKRALKKYPNAFRKLTD